MGTLKIFCPGHAALGPGWIVYYKSDCKQKRGFTVRVEISNCLIPSKKFIKILQTCFLQMHFDLPFCDPVEVASNGLQMFGEEGRQGVGQSEQWRPIHTISEYFFNKYDLKTENFSLCKLFQLFFVIILYPPRKQTIGLCWFKTFTTE